jgi:outer membrane protein assembly factor BamA
VFPFPFCPLTNWGFAHRREYLDERELPRDVLRLSLFYRQRGYRDVAVDTVVQRGDAEATVTFEIQENDPTTVGSFEVLGTEGVLDSAEVWSRIPMRVGDPLNLLVLSQGEQALVQRLQSDGYIGATVLREYFIPKDSLTADVSLRVVSGDRVRIGNVTIDAGGVVSDDVVEDFLEFRSGEYFNPEKLLDSQRILYGLDAVRWANITTDMQTADDTLADVRVEVAAASRRSVRGGLGISTVRCVEVQGSLTNRNFLGGARSLSLTGSLSNIFAKSLGGRFPCNSVGRAEVYRELNYNLGLTFRQPRVFGPNSIEAGVFGMRESVPDLYVKNSVGGQLALSRRLKPTMVATLSYRPELTSFDPESADVYFCVNFGLCRPEDIALLSEKRWLAPVRLGLRWDRANDPFQPTGGFYLSGEVERASSLTGSEYRYFRTALEAAKFHSLKEGTVLAGRFRTGYVVPTSANIFSSEEMPEDDIIFPSKRFYAGGPWSVRGVGLNLVGPTVLVFDTTDCPPDAPSLDDCAAALPPQSFDQRPTGGNVLLEANIEVRYSVSSKLTTTAFLDYGLVTDGAFTLEPSIVTPGVGLRYSSPVGPFRLDFGYNPSSATLLPVVATLPDGEIIELDRPVVYDPFTYDNPSLFTEFFRRIQVNLSIGEAF